MSVRPFSLSFCSPSSLTYASPFPSLSLLLSSSSFSLCFVPEIRPYSRGFDEILSRHYVTVWNVILRSDVSETRPVISFGTLDFISVLFRFTSAFTNTIAQWNHFWLPSFFLLVFYKKHYAIRWKESSAILQVDTVRPHTLTLTSTALLPARLGVVTKNVFNYL